MQITWNVNSHGAGRRARARRQRLNLAAIEISLQTLRRDFPRINAGLGSCRDPLTAEVVANMLAGYRLVDECLANGVDLFRPGASDRLLELNRLVLCGERGGGTAPTARQSASAEQHFYLHGDGVGALMEWLDLHRGDGVWQLAAGVFIRVLSQPQLYLEGNHRTGALLISHLLAWRGMPPFVLTAANAGQFFEPAALIKKRDKRGLDGLLKLPGLTRRLAVFLERQADSGFLQPG